MPERSLRVKLDADSADALKAMTGVRLDFDKLKLNFDKSALKVNLDDKAAVLKMHQLGASLDKLGKRVARPEVSVQGVNKALLDIARVDLALDKVNSKSSKGFFGRLRAGDYAGAAGGVAGSALGAIPGMIPGALKYAGIGVGAYAAASLAPAAVGLGATALGALPLFLSDSKQITKEVKGWAGLFTSAMAPLRPLTQGLLSQVSGVIKSLGPGLRDVAAESVPGMRVLIGMFGQMGKILLPAFSQSIRQMQPYLPAMAKGFLLLTQGLARFMVNLGPGMKASSEVFLMASQAIGNMLGWLGTAIAYMANHFRDNLHSIDVYFDDTRHFLAAEGDKIRQQFDVMRHGIAVVFDGIKNDVTTIWNALWQNTIGQAARQTRVVIGVFRSLAVGIWNDLRHLPGILYQLGKMMLTELWHGAESMVHLVTGFFTGLGHSILHVFDVITGRHSPSREMFLRGQDLMRGLAKGMQSHFGNLKAISGHIGGSVVGWIQQAMKITNAPAGWLPALERIVSLESGGNPRAFNPTAVGGEHASGLFQTLPSTYAAYATVAGGVFNPVADAVAAIRYIMSQYGSPFKIPGLFTGNYQGYWGGGWINEPVMGLGMRSGSAYGLAEHGPEYVSQGGTGGNTYTINVAPTPLASPAETGRAVVTAIREFEKRSGKSWRTP